MPRSTTVAVLIAICILAPLWVGRVRGETATPLTLNTGQQFLPPYVSDSDRFGFGVAYAAVTSVDVAQLGAGWYSDWRTQLEPSHLGGLTYTQLVRLHAGSDPTNPDLVTWLPSSEEIAEIARAHPGSLWMIGNEPDSLYHGTPILPAVYAQTYHRVAEIVHAADPTALLANAAIVQPTPCRLQYLDAVWNAYEAVYGSSMPVDVWNIHAHILREVYGEWGASTPPGIDRTCGTVYAIRDADDLSILHYNLVQFRRWMAAHGQSGKPLIISEYGILWPYRPDYIFLDEDGADFRPSRVNAYMTGSFDLFLSATDPTYGYAQDGNRLVQAWAWYSLADDVQYNGYLFYSASHAISPMGDNYADYTAALSAASYPDLSIALTADTTELDAMGPIEPGETIDIPVPLAGAISNLGETPVAGVVVSCPAIGYAGTFDLSERYAPGSTIALNLHDYTVTEPGLSTVTCTIDPGALTADPRRWNNTVTATIDARHLFTARYYLYLPLIQRASP